MNAQLKPSCVTIIYNTTTNTGRPKEKTQKITFMVYLEADTQWILLDMTADSFILITSHGLIYAAMARYAGLDQAQLHSVSFYNNQNDQNPTRRSSFA